MKAIKSKTAYGKERGVISPLILIGAASVLLLFVIFGALPFKNGLFGNLFPKSFLQAAGVVDLSLIPNTVSVSTDQTFLVDVAIDAKTDQPSAMILKINYDPSMLEALSAEQGFFFTEDLDPATPKISSGTIQMTLGQKPNQYKTGNGIIATLQFKALQPTVPTTAIQFNATDTQVASIGKTGDQVGALNGSVVTVTNTPAVNKTAQFTLTAPAGAQAGQSFNASLKALSTEDANLFSARLNFDPSLLEVVSIDTTGSFITQWVNQNNFDNTTGEISIIGGVPNPGYSNSALTTMATIEFRGKATGTGQINFAANSAIYRNSDNLDILATPTGVSVDITGVAPSPSPAASASPSPAASASPAVSASPAPSASASVAPSASPSVAPSPSPSATPLACSITQVNWITPTNPVAEGKVVGLSVTGTGGCAGKTVSFTVLEDDNFLGIIGGTDPAKNTPPPTKFNTSNVATSSWLAEYRGDNDPILYLPSDPEYFFLAQVAGSGTSVRSADPLLQVTKLSQGTFLTGDADHSGKVDDRDLSILMSNWNKTQDFIDELDLNQDGVVNAIDWATMIQILKVTGEIF